jgi:hypothetical protein
MQQISSEMYPQLVNIINQNCTDLIDSIVSAGLDGNNDIVCCAQRQDKNYTIIIEDDDNDSVKVVGLGCLYPRTAA